MRRYHAILLALHVLVMTVPVLGLALALGAPDAQLFGTEAPAPRPAFALARWADESLQGDLKKWFESHLGFRGVLVRTDNSLLYAPLGETKPGANVRRGEDGILFIDEDIGYATWRAQDRPTAEVWRALAVQLGRAQRELARRGKQMIVVLVPSKGSLYPEAFGARWSRRQPLAEPTDAFVERTLREAFAAEGVRYGDAIETLRAFPGPREAVYPKAARHWSRVGACLALQDAARPVFDVPSCAFTPRPGNMDGDAEVDLYRLLNTWHLTEPIPEVLDPISPPAAVAAAPRTLFVGSSFTWMLADVARPFVREPHFFYYNSSVYDVSTLTPRLIGPVDPASPDWPHYALEKDLYILEILEGYAHGDMFPQFLATLLARL